VDLTKGTCIGFRRNAEDRVVAVAGDQTTELFDTQAGSEWRYTPRPVTRWDKLIVGVRDNTERAIGTAWGCLLLPFIIINGSITGEWP
jgi:hypothetical protein